MLKSLCERMFDIIREEDWDYATIQVSWTRVRVSFSYQGEESQTDLQVRDASDERVLEIVRGE